MEAGPKVADTPSRVVAVAVFSSIVGHVLLIDGVACEWGVSREAAHSEEAARRLASGWFVRLRPDVIVTERLGAWMRKGARTKGLIAAIAAAAADSGAYDVSVRRRQAFSNKYEEAAFLSKRFPELAGLRPIMRIKWKTEPWTTAYFEALALAVPVLDGDAPERQPPRADGDNYPL